MIYNPEIEFDVQRAKERLNFLIEKGKRFEIKEKRERRSISQNSYLHLILSWFGIEFGYTEDEVKQEIFKKEVNAEIFYDGEKEGLVKLSKWRSTASLNTQEMTLAIDRFRDFSSKHGCYLPEPKDLAIIQQMENELSKHTSKQYL